MTAALATNLHAGPRAKSPEAFRTISEVAAELDVPQHVLRFWESRFSQVKPVKRGGGRRYYRPDDVDLLRGIRTLLYSHGLTIKGVQKLLREQGLRYVAELGRGRATLVAGAFSADDTDEADEPRHARAAIAVVEMAHGVAHGVSHGSGRAGGLSQDEAAREKLELLLGELLQLKGRLRGARAATRPL